MLPPSSTCHFRGGTHPHQQQGEHTLRASGELHRERWVAVASERHGGAPALPGAPLRARRLLLGQARRAQAQRIQAVGGPHPLRRALQGVCPRGSGLAPHPDLRLLRPGHHLRGEINRENLIPPRDSARLAYKALSHSLLVVPCGCWCVCPSCALLESRARSGWRARSCC